MSVTVKDRSAPGHIPHSRSLNVLRKAAQTCQECDLYRHATQTVFGEGSGKARLMLLGEQPGDREDIEGRPFVGPAGRLLDECLREAGIDREACYTTNIVKHFKWTPRGKRRLHEKPNALEIAACKPWFEAEVESIKPSLIVCLGATAAQAVMGRGFRVTQYRGEIFPDLVNGAAVMATVHPSAILRIPAGMDRKRESQQLVDDLKRLSSFL